MEDTKRGTAKQGRIPVSNIPYGYRVGDDGRPEIVESEAQVVRRIYRMCVKDGLGARVIGQRLVADGVPAANNAKRWWDGQVYRVLSNETYKGTWWYGKARYISTEDGIRVHEKDKDTWIPVPFPEIVDEQTWDLAQSIMKKRRTRSGRNTKIFYLLQHLVRCTGCGMLMGCMATRKRTVKRNGKVYKYELETPRRYYKCYGVQHFRTGCREHTMIRAERLEGLVWGQVKRVMENPELIVAGIESLDSQEGEGLDEQIAGAERELQKVQFEEDRAIRLYVSEKISEEQLDRQRKFITERLETLRARLADYRSKETASIEKRALGSTWWNGRIGLATGWTTCPQEKRREVLRLLLDEVTIDGENNVNFTLAVPTEELVSIGSPVSTGPCRTRGAGSDRSTESGNVPPDLAKRPPGAVQPSF